MSINTIGIDLGKTTCDVVAMDQRGKVVSRHRLSRAKLLAWLANLPPCRIGMEASCGAHHLARRLADHDAKLMPSQYVRPLVKTQQARSGRRGGVLRAPLRADTTSALGARRACSGPRCASCRSRARPSSTRSGRSCSSAGSRCAKGARRWPGPCPEVLKASDELGPTMRALLERRQRSDAGDRHQLARHRMRSGEARDLLIEGGDLLVERPPRRP